MIFTAPVSPSTAPQPHVAALAESIALRFPGPPVDPVAIAAAHDITCIHRSFTEDFEGLLVFTQGHFHIVCNDSVAATQSRRTRFTIAHELGHFFLHREAVMARGIAARYSRETAAARPGEADCDAFAASLLMPESLFRRAILPGISGLLLVQSLADCFKVSWSAAAVRALELDLFPAPAGLVFWNALGEATHRKVSPRTAGLGADYRHLTETLPTASVSAQAVDNFLVGHQQGRAHVMDWFTDLSGFRLEHEINLNEEVISLGHHGWLTLIHA